MDEDVRNAIRNYSRLNKTEQAAAAGAELLAQRWAELQKAYAGEIEEEGVVGVTAAASLLVGDRVQLWPFEGEYWEDELTYMKAFVRKECVDE